MLTVPIITTADYEILQKSDPNIVIGKIIEIIVHPDPKITKVKITKCDLGNNHIEQILCGGINIEEGLVVPIAKIDTQLSPDFVINERMIRGEVSRGMICARAELGISLQTEEDGQIWILPPESEKFLGKSLSDINILDFLNQKN